MQKLIDKACVNSLTTVEIYLIGYKPIYLYRSTSSKLFESLIDVIELFKYNNWSNHYDLTDEELELFDKQELDITTLTFNVNGGYRE